MTNDRRSSRAPETEARPATFKDLQLALSEHVEEILEAVALDHVQLSLPLDGKGLRIRVSVEAKNLERVPTRIQLRLGRRTVSIPMEACADYEKVQAF